MKSEVFKSAWNIFRMENVSFSEALTIAWQKFKSGVRVLIAKLNRTVKTGKFMTRQESFLSLVEQSIKAKRVVVDNSGAAAYYDGKTFNND